MGTPQPAEPLVFLAGPPGAGKTALGREACRRLGLRFLELGQAAEQAADDVLVLEQVLQQAVAQRRADVIELPWALQHKADVLKRCRQAGELVGLWAYPLEMQARSGLARPLFTPSGDTPTRGGFGRLGTRCPEYRRVNRACETMLDLVGCPQEKAQELRRELRLRQTPRRKDFQSAGGLPVRVRPQVRLFRKRVATLSRYLRAVLPVSRARKLEGRGLNRKRRLIAL